MEREQWIVRTSIIGMLANVFLAAFKAGVGLLSHSVAVVLDAVNNLSDALSSLITIIGTKLAGKAPDREHPLGHGRAEYLTAAVLALIVLYAGITSLIESIKKILHPETPDYSTAALLIIASAVAVKIALGLYTRGVGRQTESDALVASGSDALFDSIISASTLVAAILYLTLHWQLEAWLGAGIALIIIKSGYEMIRDTISELLGERIQTETARAVKNAVTSFPLVQGAYDLVIHSYGPGRLIGSVHIEVPDTATADTLDLLEREITQKVLAETGVVMTGISIYSMNTRDEAAVEMRETIRDIALAREGVLQIHGFYKDEAAKAIRFDIIVSFDVADRLGVCREVQDEVHRRYPEYQVEATLDYDISD